MSSISPTTTVISAILLVVVLIVAFSLRKKIKRNERGNEFFPWERDEAQGNEVVGIHTDEEYDKLTDDDYETEDDYEDDEETEDDYGDDDEDYENEEEDDEDD